MANTISNSALRPKLWQKALVKNVKDNLYFSKFMGAGEENIIQIKDDLKKERGDTITLPITYKLSSDGVVGDAELEGNEEAITAYSDSISIDQVRNGVRTTGEFDEQTNVYDMRNDNKNKLSMWAQEFLERQFFMKLGGVNNLTLTDVAGNVVGGRAAWANAPEQVPTADTGLGYGDRYLCADYADGADSLDATDLLTPELISLAKIKAGQKQSDGAPKMRPLMINGKSHYVMFIHPWQANDLKNNATYAQAQRDAQARGNDNPIFTGALGMWDNVIIHEHEYVPYLDVSEAGYNFNSADAGTIFGGGTVDCFRALLCGAQAGVFANTSKSFMMREKDFDYGNKVGYSTGIIGGVDKVTFNEKDYGVLALDTAATAIV